MATGKDLTLTASVAAGAVAGTILHQTLGFTNQHDDEKGIIITAPQ